MIAREGVQLVEVARELLHDQIRFPGNQGAHADGEQDQCKERADQQERLWGSKTRFRGLIDADR